LAALFLLCFYKVEYKKLQYVPFGYILVKNNDRKGTQMNNIINLLETYGPLTGKEIHEKTVMDILDLWKYCNECADITMRIIGTRYLRLDKHVEGFARLSPSIIREFYNYTVINLLYQTEAADSKAEGIRKEIINISKNKFQLARNIMEKIIESQPAAHMINEKVCFMISGDVAYEMAHLEPRPEFSTGRIVNGSDLDIVIVYKDLPENIVKDLDSSIYGQKYYLLSNPSYREEIDYVIKDISRVDKQLEFKDFESMVASKVLEEGKFLCGSYALFSEIKKMVADRGIPEKLSVLKEKASIERENARLKLLEINDSIIDKGMMHLFYTTDEREEFY